MASKKKSNAGSGLGLLTDFLAGIRAHIKAVGGDENALMERLREPGIVTAVVQLLMHGVHGVQKVLEFVDRTIVITMDPTKTVGQLVADGRYDWVNPDVKKFTITSEAGSHVREIVLLWYDKIVSSQFVLDDMERQGLRPATFLELLWIGVQYDSLQTQFPIVALGMVVRVIGFRSVAYLRRGVGGRSLVLGWFGGGWGAFYRFAAVRTSICW